MPTYAGGQVKSDEAASPWTVDYGEERCTLIRTFSNAAGPVVLNVSPWPLGDQVNLLLVLPKSKKAQDFAVGSVIVDKDKSRQKLYFDVHPGKVESTSVFSTRFEQSIFRAQIASGSILNLQADEYAIPVPLDGGAAALKALDVCLRDLLSRWGMNTASQETIAVAPRGNVSQFFRDTDYPDDALRANAQGTVGIHYWVKPDGRAYDCRVAISSGYASLDAKSCAVVKSRARFKPAADPTGKLVPSLSYAEIIWSIPEN